MQELSEVSDNALLQEVRLLASSQRCIMADLVRHLAEVDARRLYAKRGFPSLFSYCVEELRFSEDEACRRIEAARLGAKFPVVYESLKTGTVTLSVLGLLKPHLTEDNHRELLAGVSDSSVRRAKEWLAARFPQPDVPCSIRKHPERNPAARPARTLAPSMHPATSRVESDHDASPPAMSRVTPDHDVSPPAMSGVTPDHDISPPAMSRVTPDECDASDISRFPSSPVPSVPLSPPFGLAPPAPLRQWSRSAGVEPLSRDRFLVKMTVGGAVRDKLELARDLLSHANPSGDLAVVVERALDELLGKLEKAKLGRAHRPPRGRRTAKWTHVASGTRREVVARDGLECSFVAPDGRRCGARAFLEFDHETPKGRGGSSEPHNVRILCRVHNLLVAERIYGTAHMQRAISTSRGRRKET